jgi:flagellar basal-body rod protein FlgC
MPRLDGLFRPLAVPASGITAQRRRMELIASNIANAHVTGGADVAPYRARAATLAPVEPTASPMVVKAGEIPAAALPPVLAETPGVAVTGIVEGEGEARMSYEPGHPDADADGYVRYPDVDITQELVGLMETRRLYEANVTVFQAMKSMLQKSLEI